MRSPNSARSPRSRVLARIVSVLAALTLLAAACGDDDDEPLAEDIAEDVDENGADDTTDDATDTEETAQVVATYEAQLEQLNSSSIEGTATVESLDDGRIAVTVETTGYAGGNAHLQHLHIGGEHTCPDIGMTGDDSHISTIDGVPAYGEVRVSLTTEGDVSPASAVEFDRYPVAEEDGTLTYERTFELPVGVDASDLGEAVLVQHGWASLGGDETTYDGDDESSIAPNEPLEATMPVTCGVLEEQ